MPDEEIGGNDGLAPFVKTPQFQKMNVGFGLDEGLASPTGEVDVYYAERNEYWVSGEVSNKPNFIAFFSLRFMFLVILAMARGLWKTQQLRRQGT